MTSKIYLKKNEDRRIRMGHLWVFSNEISGISGSPGNGDIVEVFDYKKNIIGSGFYNKNSLIAVRILSSSTVMDLNHLIKNRIRAALALRKEFYPERNSFRMVFSESDYLPGLIIDKYNNTFVIQVNSFGMQNNIELVVKELTEKHNASNIFTKNDSYLRKLEGLPEPDELSLGERGIEIIDDGSIKYKIDFNRSQKTGFYFDQCDNRNFIEKITSEKKVADIFCNSGGFGLHAIKAGASSVDFVDSSSIEIDNVKENIKLNNLDSVVNYFVEDSFKFLEKAIENKVSYDVVMVDPPAFAKNKRSLPTAEKGYEKLNVLALQIINENGFLVSSSCSYHLSKDKFLNAIMKAAAKSSKKLQFIHFNGASLDHPQLTAMPETSYLKFAVFRVING